LDPKDGFDRGSVREFDEEMIDLGILLNIKNSLKINLLNCQKVKSARFVLDTMDQAWVLVGSWTKL